MAGARARRRWRGPRSQTILAVERRGALRSARGRVAIVTGGNGGIGLGMARGLAEAGASLVIAARDADKSAKALEELRGLGGDAMAVEVEVTSAKSVQAMVQTALDRHSRLDVLINNAGTNIRKQPQEYALEEWHLILEVNLTSAFLCCQAAYPALREAGGGKIVNIGSMMSIFGASFAAAYAASTGGIVQLTKALACAGAKDGIQVNAVLPGWIDSALTRRARADIPELHERVVARTPAGRWGTPDDLAGIAVFLASPASDFLTGTAIPVDGGYSVQG